MIIPIDHELEVSEIIEVPQIIQVMDDHDLVLNSMFVGIPHCQKYPNIHRGHTKKTEPLRLKMACTHMCNTI